MSMTANATTTYEVAIGVLRRGVFRSYLDSCQVRGELSYRERRHLLDSRFVITAGPRTWVDINAAIRRARGN